ncbi:MAG: type II toxin-antitoxin system RelE/ParE family toxin [Thermoanaerobaculia bacterium]
MIELRKTAEFASWFDGLKDPGSRARVLVRIRRLSLGNPGDAHPVGQGVCELRLHFGPGLRIYFMARGAFLVVLLCGGDKSRQARDNRRAIELSNRVEE